MNTVAVVCISGEVLADVAYDAALPVWVQAKLEAGEVRLMVERDGRWENLTVVASWVS